MAYTVSLLILIINAELLTDYSFLIFIIFLHGLIEFHMFLQLKKINTNVLQNINSIISKTKNNFILTKLFFISDIIAQL